MKRGSSNLGMFILAGCALIAITILYVGGADTQGFQILKDHWYTVLMGSFVAYLLFQRR